MPRAQHGQSQPRSWRGIASTSPRRQQSTTVSGSCWPIRAERLGMLARSCRVCGASCGRVQCRPCGLKALLGTRPRYARRLAHDRRSCNGSRRTSQNRQHGRSTLTLLNRKELSTARKGLGRLHRCVMRRGVQCRPRGLKALQLGRRRYAFAVAIDGPPNDLAAVGARRLIVGVGDRSTPSDSIAAQHVVNLQVAGHRRPSMLHAVTRPHR